jgi:O-antigen ligase
MNISQTYVKILRWGVFVSLFIPLIIFSQYLSPFHFGKIIVFRTLVELMAVFYILLILVRKEYRPKWSLLLTSVSVFTGLYIFSGIIGVNFYQSMWGTLERMGGIFSFIHFWVYFVILISIIRNKADWHKLFKISIFVGFLSILFAYGQRLRLGNFFVGWQHGDRVIGTIGNPALFAGYVLFILFLALWFLLKKKTNVKEKGFYAAVIILGTPVLLMTAVRGAILSFFATLFLLAIFFIFSSKSKGVKAGLLVAIIILLFLTGFILLNKDKFWVKNISWLNRLTTISLETETAQTRLWSWNSAIQGWKDKPIFGWGPENFAVLHMKYFDARHFTGMGSETIWDRAHNILLNTLATMGIVGLLSYLSIFFFFFYILIKKFKEKKIGKITLGVLSAMIIAYVGQNLFIFDTMANYFLFFLVLGYVNYLDFSKSSFVSTKVGTMEDKSPSILLTVILLILAIVLIYQTNIEPAKANYACTRGILAGRAGNVQEAVDKYRQAIDYDNPQGAYEIKHKFASFAIQYTENMRQKDKDFDPSLLYYAIEKVGENIKRFPLDTIPYLYVGRMYILLIDKEPEIAGQQAEEAIKRAIDINPKNPRIWYELGQAQLSLERYQESYESFETAAELNPEVPLSWWFVGVTAFQAEHYQEASDAIEKAVELGYKGFQDNIQDLMRLVQIYEKVENYQGVVEAYELAVQEQPTAQMYASLAAAYAKIMQYEKAVWAALKSAEIDPDFREEAQAFIDSLPRVYPE